MRVVWGTVAKRDLLNIVDYISQENPSAADRVLTRIRETADGLSVFPRRNAEIAPGRYRAIVRGFPYMVRYRIEPDPLDPASEHVLIVSVRHMARRPDV